MHRTIELYSPVSLPWALRMIYSEDPHLFIEQRACYSAEEHTLTLHQSTKCSGTPLDDEVRTAATIRLSRTPAGAVDLNVMIHTECLWNSPLAGLVERFAHSEHTGWFGAFAAKLSEAASKPAGLPTADSVVSAIPETQLRVCSAKPGQIPPVRLGTPSCSRTGGTTERQRWAMLGLCVARLPVHPGPLATTALAGKRLLRAVRALREELGERACVDHGLESTRGEEAGKKLIEQAMNGCTAGVLQLVVARAPLDVRDECGTTALMMAAKQGHTAIAQALIGAGAGLDLPDQNGDTALMLAAAKGHTAIATSLLGAGAGLDLQNQQGKTAMIYTAECGHTETAAALIGAADTMLYWELCERAKIQRDVQDGKCDRRERCCTWAS